MDKKFIYMAVGGFVLFILIAVLAVTSCGKKTTTTAGTTLVFWDYTDNKAAFTEIINDFQTQNKIKIDYQVKDPAEYLTNSTSTMVAGKGPDIWALPNNDMPKYADKLVPMPTGKLADKKKKLSDLDVYKETYPTAVSENNIIGEKIFGIPMTVDNLILYYNGAIFTDSMAKYQKSHSGEDLSAIRKIFTQGPKNWDEFVQAVRALKEINTSAVALGTSENINSATDILTLLMLQYGALMTSPELTTAQFHTAQNEFGGQPYPGTRALDFYTSFATSGNANDTWNKDMSDSIRAFAEGKVAMLFAYESDLVAIKLINPKAATDKIAVPQIKETKNPINVIKYTTYTVPKSSTNQTMAWNFINTATDKDHSSKFSGVNKQQSARRTTSTYNYEMKTTKSWYNPDPAKTNDIFKNMIKQVNDGGNAQTAIENAASQVTTLLGKLKE